jgi:hypothetical protein
MSGRKEGIKCNQPKEAKFKQEISYQRSKCFGSLTSTATLGSPTVRKPRLMQFNKLIPANVAMTIMVRPFGRNCVEDSTD